MDETRVAEHTPRRICSSTEAFKSARKRTADDAELQMSSSSNPKRSRIVSRDRSSGIGIADTREIPTKTGSDVVFPQASILERPALDGGYLIKPDPSPDPEAPWGKPNTSFRSLMAAGKKIEEPTRRDRTAFRSWLEQRYQPDDPSRGSPIYQYLTERCEESPHWWPEGCSRPIDLALWLDSSEFKRWTEAQPDLANYFHSPLKALYEDPRPSNEREHHHLRRYQGGPRPGRTREAPQDPPARQRRPNNKRLASNQNRKAPQKPREQNRRQSKKKHREAHEREAKQTDYTRHLRSGIGNRKHRPPGTHAN